MDEKEKEKQTSNVVNADNDIIEMYKKENEELRNNTVSRENYDKLKNELISARKELIDHRQVATDKKVDDNKDWKKILDEKAKKITSGKPYKSNLEYFKDVLELRDAFMHETGKDPFVRTAENIKERKGREEIEKIVSHRQTPNELEESQEIYDGMADLVERSENNADEFDALYSWEIRGAK